MVDISKLRLFDRTEFIDLNILGLRDWVAKIKGLEIRAKLQFKFTNPIFKLVISLN